MAQMVQKLKALSTRTKVIVVAALVGAIGLVMWLSKDEPPQEKEASAAPAAVSVRVAEVLRGDIQSWVFAEGTVRSVDREYLTFPAAGRVTYVKSGLREGDRVKKGELLANLNQRQAESDVASARSSVEEARSQERVARAQLEQAKTESSLAERKLERFKRLLALASASPQEVDQAQAEFARAQASVEQAQSRITAAQTQISAAQARVNQSRVTLEDTRLVSPIDGVLAVLNVTEGGYFMPSIVRTDSEQNALQTVPMVVISPDNLEVRVEVPAFQGGSIRQGQTALLSTGQRAGTGGEPRAPLDTHAAKGTVYSVTPAISPEERAIVARIRTTDRRDNLRDGMFVTAWIATAGASNALAVPLEALVYRENKPYVFVVNAKSGTVAERAVKLGLQGLSSQEVLEGVEHGEMVVTEGRHQLADGAAVRIIGKATAPAQAGTAR